MLGWLRPEILLGLNATARVAELCRPHLISISTLQTGPLRMG